ncbi:MAG: hypothetical protein H7250_08920 [Flavobacterium sp.]|nr:hypothetical protein [Flavobacterium sp.]
MKKAILIIFGFLVFSISYSQNNEKALQVDKVVCKSIKEKNDLGNLSNAFKKVDKAQRDLKLHRSNRYNTEYNAKYLLSENKDYLYRGILKKTFDNDSIELETILENCIHEYNEIYDECDRKYSWIKFFPRQIVFYFELQDIKFTPIENNTNSKK